MPSVPMRWLSHQTNDLLLDHMTVLSKNPHYYSSSPTADDLDTIDIKRIPRDTLQIREEIGEGAFGKVYKGTEIIRDVIQ